jgi:hypothetical protein
MPNAHTLLAIANQCLDLDLQGRQQLRVWLRLRQGAVADQLPGFTGLRDAFDRHATGWVPVQQLAALAADPAVDDLEIAEVLRLERAPPRWPAGTGRAGAAPAAAPAGALMPPGTAGDEPVLGLIDTGLPFAHLGLQRPGVQAPSTRLVALWDQDPAPDFGALGLVPAPFGFGAVLPRAAMEQAMAAAAASGGGEAAAYAAAGQGTVAARRTHGAHVLGLLAMDAPYVDAALGITGGPDSLYGSVLRADLLGVQLPRAALHSPSRAALCGAVLDGLLWMRSVCPGRRLRVAIPYGSTLGPHDGSSLFEQALDQLVRQSAGLLEVFLPAGNSFRLNLHATLQPAAARSAAQDLVWRMPPGSEAASFVELWLPPGLDARLDVLAPDGSLVLAGIGAGPQAVLGQGGAAGVSLRQPSGGGAQQQVLLVRLAPTLVVDSGRTPALPGDWCLRLHSASGPAQGLLHAYGTRARGSFGAVARAQQPRLLAPAGAAWQVQHLGTISGMATGQAATVVGGYVMAAMRAGARHLPLAANYTAAGEGRNRRRVDCALPSEVSAALRGVRSAGTLSAISWRMDGSSVAVPQAVRVGTSAAPARPRYSDRRLGRPIVP